LLNEHGIAHTYREYTKDPLSADELRDVLAKLGMSAKEAMRKRDAKKAGLTGEEGDDVLIAAMAGNPRLLQRPIGVVGDKAAMGRPIENLLTIV